MFGSAPSTSTPSIRLAEVLDEVWALISDGMFNGMSRVLTLVATHHPDLDFTAICSGYADGWSTDAIHVLGESLLPHAQLVAEQVSTQWVMEAHRASMAESVRQEDVIQPTTEPNIAPSESVAGSEASVVSPPTEPNVAPSESEQPLSSSVALSTDVVGQP